MSDQNKPILPRSVIDSGIIALIIVSIAFSGYMINQALEISVQTKQNQEKTDKKIDEFVNRWEQRVKISNLVNNGTRETVRQGVLDLIGNLSAHRSVTNSTFDEVKQIENITNDLIRKFNSTNEEERTKAVDKIITAVDKNTDLLSLVAQALNVTVTAEMDQPNKVNTDQKLNQSDLVELLSKLTSTK